MGKQEYARRSSEGSLRDLERTAEIAFQRDRWGTMNQESYDVNGTVAHELLVSYLSVPV